MIRIRLGTERVAAALAAAKADIADMSDVYVDIGEYMVRSTKTRFGRSEAPDGTKWRAKSQATLDRYRKRGDGPRPLPLIGPSERLRDEVNYTAGAGSVEIGSALEYSGVMQEGAAKGAFGNDKRGRPTPWGDIPARVWLGLSRDDETNIIDIVDEAIAAGLGEPSS